MTQNEFFILQGGRMSRSGLRQLMTTQQMKIQASYLAKYEQVSTLDRDADIFRKLDMTYRGWTIKRRIYKKSLIFYVVKENEVHVLRVLTSNQKWQDLFEDDIEYTYTI